jgi:chemotaxis methyl-accepting protein methylase/methyl-accepting chemotaxis protein
MAQSATVMREMGKRTTEISGIVNTINLIAERTNLLSLNASIEAARAGEAGRGFAVVAEEIRNLADRAAQATSDIAAIIKALQEVAQEAIHSANDGLKVAHESGQLAEGGMGGLQKILTGIRQTSDLVGQMARASEEQLRTGQQVVTAVTTTATQARQASVATAEQTKNAQAIAQASAHMRGSAQQVTIAMAEQGRAAREIIKASQNTNSLASRLKKASTEQSAGAQQINESLIVIRRSSVATSEVVARQTAVAEEVLGEAEKLARQAAQVIGAMDEQAAASVQISKAVETMRRQSEQLARAMTEQTRATKDMLAAAQDVSKQIGSITRSKSGAFGIRGHRAGVAHGTAHRGRPERARRATSPPRRRGFASAGRSHRRGHPPARGQRPSSSTDQASAMTGVAESPELPVPVFVILRDLIHDRTGLHYADDKRELLADKLFPRVREVARGSFLDYYYRLKYETANDDEEWSRLQDALATPETFFWREADHLQTLVHHLTPQFFAQDRPRTLRIWSAACSSGEEPLSIAMALDEAGWFDRGPISIQASDASPAAIAKARRGVYRERSLRNLPPRLRDRYFSRSGDDWEVAAELRSRVEWTTANLVEASAIERLATASIVFCRNVFIYFSPASIQKVVNVLARQMTMPGYLLLGAAESIHQVTDRFELREIDGSFVYVKQALPAKAEGH